MWSRLFVLIALVLSPGCEEEPAFVVPLDSCEDWYYTDAECMAQRCCSEIRRCRNSEPCDTCFAEGLWTPCQGDEVTLDLVECHYDECIAGD